MEKHNIQGEIVNYEFGGLANIEVHLEIEYDESKKGWQVNDVLERVMETSNRDPETEEKLNRLSILAKKKMNESIKESELDEFRKLRSEIKLLIPEDDIAIEKVVLSSIKEMIGE